MADTKTIRKQKSESLLIGVLLAISGGIMDAYSYLYRGRVFANAQTGNILLFSVHLSKGEWKTALHYAFPILAFLSGVALATFICHFGRQRKWLHWRQICVLFEAAVLFLVAWFLQSANLLANSFVSLACGVQVEAFRKIDDANVATTMCIGNLRSATHSAIMFVLINHREDRYNAHISFAMVLAFAFGAVIGSILLRSLGAYSICCGSGIMLICFIIIFFSSSEIRKNTTQK